MDIVPGAVVTPKVTLREKLSEGGMGALWIAEHAGLGCDVAVKFLLGEYVHDAALRARFAQEASAASKVKSSHVVKIYDFGVTDTDVPYLVMELLEGTDLRSLLVDRGRLEPAEAIAIVAQLCRALDRAHAADVIHRDIKPENVFLTNEAGEWFVKLLDFGVAKTTKPLATSNGGAKSTLANETLGTPFYMSPEQFRSSKTIDARTDLWSVGVMTYEMLAGTLPYSAETVSALAITVNEGKAPKPSTYEPSLPAAFDAWFEKACAHDPADRFASARELIEALRKAFDVSDASGPIRFAVSERKVAATKSQNDSLSLRETAFATTHHNRRSSRAWIVAAVAVPMLVGVVVLAFRSPTHGSTALPHPTASPRATTTTAPSVSVVVQPTATVTAVAGSASALPAPPMSQVATHATHAPSAAASAPKKRDDVDIY